MLNYLSLGCATIVFMIWEPSDIIGAVSAGLLLVTIGVSLFLGIKSLRLANKLEEKKFRLGLLNELMQWAIDVFACCRVRIDDKGVEELKRNRIDFGSTRDIIVRASSIARKIEYFNNKDLNDKIEELDQAVTLCHNSMIDVYNGERELDKSDLTDIQLKIIKEDFKMDKKKLIPIDIAREALVKIQIDIQHLLSKANGIIEADLKK